MKKLCLLLIFYSIAYLGFSTDYQGLNLGNSNSPNTNYLLPLNPDNPILDVFPWKPDGLITYITGNNSSDNVLLAWSNDGNFGTPVDGTSYSVGNTLPGAGGIIIYKGPPDNFVYHTGLNPATRYYYKAWSLDGSNNYSSGGCTGDEMTSYELPFIEGFNSSTTPTDWVETIVADPGTDPELSYIEDNQSSYPQEDPFEGARMLKFNSYSASAGAKIKLESPYFSTLNMTKAVVEFEWFESSGVEASNDSVIIQYSSGGGTWYDFARISRYNEDDDWYYKQILLPSAVLDNGAVQLAFLFYSAYGWDCLLDDLSITEPKPEPSNHVLSFNAQALSSNSIKLTWNQNDGSQPADYYLIVGKTGAATYYNPVDGTEDEDDIDWSDNEYENTITHTNSYTITNLSPLTTYDFKIYPFTNSGLVIDYKTYGTVPEASAKTLPNPRDDNTTVANTTQPAGGDFSSLRDTDVESLPVLKFTIEDKGTSDGIPTIITKIRLKPYSTNTVDWTDAIHDAFIEKDGVWPIPDNIVITDNYIDITYVAEDFKITDGTTSTITIHVYLNKSNITDGDTFSMMIDADDHGFVADKYGSDFESTFIGGDIHSNDFTITVIATELHFLQDASDVHFYTDMSPAPTIIQTDENENRDTDGFSGMVISITDDSTKLINSPVNASIINGIATFNSLQFSSRCTNNILYACDKDNVLGTNESTFSLLFDVFDNTSSDILISEVSDPKTNPNAKFVELYNPTSSSIDLSAGSYYLSIRNNGTGTQTSVALNGSIAASATYVCSLDDGNPSTFENFYGAIENKESNTWNGDGNDPYYLYKGGDHNSGSLLDIYGVDNQDGTGKDWEYTDSHAVRKRCTDRANSEWTSSEWIIVPANADQMTPGKHAQTITWQANGNNDWNTWGASNWSGEFVPDASDNVSISSGTGPTITEPAACNSLTNSSGYSVSVNPGKTMTIVNDIQISNNWFRLDSDITNGPSSLLHYTNLSADVSCSFVDLNKWYLISSPINNASSNLFFGQYLEYWNEATAHWVDITSSSSDLTPGKGYSLKKTNDHNITYSGTLNDGDITISNLHYTSNNPDSLKGWNLLGNPYPSVLDFKKIDLTGVSAVAGVSVWPHNGTTSSSYISYSQGGGGNNEARYIQPGQGFMFQLSADNQSLTFTNDARTHIGLASFDKSKNKTNNYPESLRITVQGEATTIDETYISFREGATTGFDPYYDIHKLFGNTANPHIFSYIDIEESELAAIQSFPQPAEGDIVHLGVRIGSVGNYELNFSGMSTFTANQAFILIDKKLNDTYSVRKDSSITFYHELSDSENRFDLLFEMTTGLYEINDNSDHIIVYFNDNNLYIRNLTFDNKNTNIEIFDILGQKLIEEKIGDATRGIPVDLPSAYYIIKIQSEKETITKKIFIP